MIENYVRILAFLYYNFEQYYGLVQSQQYCSVANFWMLFATLSAYVVVALEVDREALAHVACAQIFLD